MYQPVHSRVQQWSWRSYLGSGRDDLDALCPLLSQLFGQIGFFFWCFIRQVSPENKQTNASSDSSSWTLSIPKCRIIFDILRFFILFFYSNICPCAALCLLNSLKGYMEICESLLFNSWSFSSVKQCVKMTSHSFRNPFLRSYLRAFLRFFSSAFSFWAKVKDSASARLSTAMARKTFRRMTESRPSQDYNHCETFTHKHKHKHKPEHELGEDTVPTDKEDDEVQAD